MELATKIELGVETGRSPSQMVKTAWNASTPWANTDLQYTRGLPVEAFQAVLTIWLGERRSPIYAQFGPEIGVRPGRPGSPDRLDPLAWQTPISNIYAVPRPELRIYWRSVFAQRVEAFQTVLTICGM